VIEARQLEIEIGGRVTLREASFVVRAGDKVGLVGRNGAGKTTLLRALAGQHPTVAGAISTRGRLGFLSQDPRALRKTTEGSALSRIISGRGLDSSSDELERLRAALETDHSDAAIKRYARAEELFAARGGYAAEAEARKLAAGLSLQPGRVDLPVGVLSGGERRRVELARILFRGTDVLLLDEPTNHLDNDAKNWLLSFLRTYRGALLVVSHDLALLDEAITRVLHLDQASIVEYKGTYSQYLAARRADEDRQRKLATRQQAEIKRLSSLAESMRHQTEKRARIAKTLDSRVARLRSSAVQAPGKSEHHYKVRFPAPPHSGRLALEVESLAQAYGGPPIFTDVGFAIERGQRLLVMGLNGAGKTSLLRILAGVAQPAAGSFRYGSGVTCGYYAQEHEGLQGELTVLEHLRALSPAPEKELRGVLGMFGLTGEIAFQTAGTLSGGERTKLALAQLVVGRYNLLLLDEPTNNLDPPSREGVGRALAAWPGTMVVVSHDVGFVSELTPGKVLVMPDGIEDWWSDDLAELVALA
jgi:ATPase subunit of ABC transporter with duplicated ATPase domains